MRLPSIAPFTSATLRTYHLDSPCWSYYNQQGVSRTLHDGQPREPDGKSIAKLEKVARLSGKYNADGSIIGFEKLSDEERKHLINWRAYIGRRKGLRGKEIQAQKVQAQTARADQILRYATSGAKNSTPQIRERCDKASARGQGSQVSNQERDFARQGLYEELFPNEAAKSTAQDTSSESLWPPKRHENRPSRLKWLSSLELDGAEADTDHAPTRSTKSLKNPFRERELTVMILSRASTSLCESDFRRIIPRGKHIDEWKGPGDFIKVIPGRDPKTLLPQPYYFLVFPNKAYAYAYQEQVLHLHRTAEAYTPQPSDSHLEPSPGQIINGENVYAMLQDYALYPPSHPTSLRLVDSMSKESVRRIMSVGGYGEIVTPKDKSKRSVMFWVKGQQLTLSVVRHFLAKDGQDRGIRWSPLGDEGSIEMFEWDSKHAEENEVEAQMDRDIRASSDEWVKKERHGVRASILAFKDETEARRFVRVWDRRDFPELDIPHPGRKVNNAAWDIPKIRAEFLW